MMIVAIAILLATYFFWLYMVVRVHRLYEGKKEGRVPLTLTFYSLGLLGPLYLIASGPKTSPLAQFTSSILSFFTDFSLKGKKSGAVVVGGERIDISLIGHDGEMVEPGGAARGASGDSLRAGQLILQTAIRQHATDVHFEPEPDQLKIRYRIDGMLQARTSYPLDMAQTIVSAMKVLSGVDVAERRRAQDGSFGASLDGRRIDFRVATSGTLHGEKMVVRVLDKTISLRTLSGLGLSERNYARLKDIVESTHGMLIVVGPTGSGKTTSLYGALQEVDTAALNVITIEDPIEYNLTSVNQLQINEKAGITFAKLLRTTLRQDPDILMVGEIRDKETAQIAMQAALTGHFVYTTLHANDTVSAVFRLFDLAVQPYLIGTSVTAMLAQRLIRKLCPDCRIQRTPKPGELEKLGLPPDKVRILYESNGCPKCYGTGYRGRLGIFELLVLDDEMRDLIQREPSIPEMRKAARKAGLISLKQDAAIKAARGITSVKEALRVTR